MSQNNTVATASGLTPRLIAGAIGGIAGGIVFGIMMGMMGMLTMIAGMMGSDSAVVGFIIHIMISIIFGLGFAFIPARFTTSFGLAAVAGVIYGIILWVVGPLIIMPLMMGGAVFTIGKATMMSLMGHIIYAVITVIVAVLVLRKRA